MKIWLILGITNSELLIQTQLLSQIKRKFKITKVWIASLDKRLGLSFWQIWRIIKFGCAQTRNPYSINHASSSTGTTRYSAPLSWCPIKDTSSTIHLSYQRSWKKKMKELDEVAYQLLRESKQFGKTYIVTNAGEGWVELSSSRFLPKTA